jgi:uncharacterized protein YjiS (DUF1127 family)
LRCLGASARIGPEIPEHGLVTELIYRAIPPESGAALQERSSPAGRSVRARAAGAAGCRALVRRALARSLEYVVAQYLDRRDRRRLARLDDRMLRDIGVERGAVERDSTASFWRLR